MVYQYNKLQFDLLDTAFSATASCEKQKTVLSLSINNVVYAFMPSQMRNSSIINIKQLY